MLTVAFIDVLGLPFDGSTLTNRGLGGSESAIILMAKELAAIGFSVKVFNDCVSGDCSPGVYDGVEYKPLQSIEDETSFDIFIGSRSAAPFCPPELSGQFKTFTGRIPNFSSVHARSRYRILWMHDTFCDGDNYIEDLVTSGRIDKIFTLSDWHTTYIMTNDHGYKKRNFEVLKPFVWQTRNGIVLYKEWVDIKAKDPDLFVYNSSITKGMKSLLKIVWPEVKSKIPSAKLCIIGGYYRMRDEVGADKNEQDWRELKQTYDNTNGIYFTGIIRQDEIAEVLSKATFTLYPCTFPETFGISTLESLAYNTPVITSRFGALEETAIDIASYKINYPIEPNSLFDKIDPVQQLKEFVDLTVSAYNNKYLLQQKQNACNIVKTGCLWSDVALQWKQHFFRVFQEYLSIDEYRKVQIINHKISRVFNRNYSTPEMFGGSYKNIEKKINVIVPFYNAENYIERCMESIFTQDYNNYSVYLIDDKSTDKTVDKVLSKLDNLPINIRNKVTFIKNEVNYGAVCNQISTIKNFCEEDSIIMLIDGDDWLISNPNIFNNYNNMFYDGAEYVYGSCWSIADNIPLIAQEYPPEVKERKEYRNYRFNWNMPYPHLRVFLAKFVHNLSDDAFKDDTGSWYRAGGDNATFYNIIEQAEPKKVRCSSDIVYVYNDLNPLNDYKVNKEQQTISSNKIINCGSNK